MEEDTAKQLLATAEEFAREEIAPRVAEYDRTESIPEDLLAKLAELGFFGGIVPVEHGGLGLDHVTFVRLIETVSVVCNAVGTLLSLPSGLVGSGISAFGTPEQKQRWLKPLAEGRIFGGAGVTEPQSGSDVASMRTSYRKEGDEFVLNGAKAWISQLALADFFVTFATHDRSLKHRGVTAFIVPKATPGVTVRPYKDKLGFRPLATGDLVFDDVRIGPEMVLGVEGDGFKVAMTAVERGRLSVTARSVGVTQACLNEAVKYAGVREAFGHSISEFQLVQSKITDMEIGLRTGRLLMLEAARALDRGERARKLTSMSKMYASDVAFRSASDALQIHGAYGVSPEYPMGRYLRDAKVLQIVEGSNDLHRALIGEMALGMRKSS